MVGAAMSAPIAGAGRQRRARSGRCATRSWSSSSARSRRSGCPEKVDSSAGEQQMSLRAEHGRPAPRHPDPAGGGLRAARQLRAAVAVGLPDPVPGVPAARPPDRRLGGRPELLVGLVIGAAGAGNGLAVVLAALAKKVNPAITVVAMLLPTRRWCSSPPLFYGAGHPGALGLAAGLAQSLAKLSLDATIQAAYPAHIQASAVRPQRHHGAAGLGDRRVRRHRDAADRPASGSGRRRAPCSSPGRCSCSAPCPAGRAARPPDRPGGPGPRVRARARRRARAAAWRRAGRCCASGCRPCR